MDIISDIWERHGHLHIFVELLGHPTLIDTGGEYFIRLFAPAQDI
jgi:hypothetical protein